MIKSRLTSKYLAPNAPIFLISTKTSVKCECLYNMIQLKAELLAVSEAEGGLRRAETREKEKVLM